MRTVPVPDFIGSILQLHIDRVGQRQADVADPLLFTTRTKLPLSRTRFASRFWKPAVTFAGIHPQPTFHSLRHSYAGWLIAQGAHPKEIQELMGHTSIRTTLDRYGHLMRTIESQQRSRMNAALRGERGRYVARGGTK